MTKDIKQVMAGKLQNHTIYHHDYIDIWCGFLEVNMKVRYWGILFFLLIGLFLLPLFSINKHNISFFEFTGMIGIFIFLCSWYWSKIKKEKNYE